MPFVHRTPLQADGRLAAAAQLAATLGRDVDRPDVARRSPVMQVQGLATGRRLFSGDPVADLDAAGRALRDCQDLPRWRGPMMRSLVARLVGAGRAA